MVIQYRIVRSVTLVSVYIWSLSLGAGLACGNNRQDTLPDVLSRIDRSLLRHNEQDIRDWLDARLVDYGDFGLYKWGHPSIEIHGDSAQIDLNRGAFADAAAQFFRAYEMLGDERYLRAGIATADFFLAIQQPAGHFPCGATVYRDGRIVAGGGKCSLTVVRMEDGYQFRPFALLMYAYKLTGDLKYFGGAKRYADLLVQRIQHPEWGWCPDEFDLTITGDASMQRSSHSNYGVRGGGSWSDGATTEGFRASLIMYHATDDVRYLQRAARLGRWVFATQMGEGTVRGWADNYNADNKPVPARRFEGLMIDPRNFDRFTGPLLTWLYAITGDEKYATLFVETYEWMRSQEHPDGWPAEFTSMGEPAWTQDHTTYLYSQPESWPEVIEDVEVRDNRPWYGREKVQLEDSRKIYELMKEGREAVMRWFAASPVSYDSAQYAAARMRAAMRCTDAERTVLVRDPETLEPVTVNFIERVQMRLAAPGAAALPYRDGLSGRTGLEVQCWHSPHTWQQPYRPPFGWASWQYVWEARIALGMIGADRAADGGRGLQVMHYWCTWDVMGDWTTRCLEVENWMAVPPEAFPD